MKPGGQTGQGVHSITACGLACDKPCGGAL